MLLVTIGGGGQLHFTSFGQPKKAKLGWGKMRQINLVFWILFRGKIQVSWTFRDWDKNYRNLPHFTSFGQPKRQNWDEVKWGKMGQFALILPHSGSQKRQNWDEVKWGWPPPHNSQTLGFTCCSPICTLYNDIQLQVAICYIMISNSRWLYVI